MAMQSIDTKKQQIASLTALDCLLLNMFLRYLWKMVNGQNQFLIHYSFKTVEGLVEIWCV